MTSKSTAVCTHSWNPSPCSVHSATVTGGTPVPVCASHSSPPLHPPLRHASGPLFWLKSQLRRPQIRPAFQLSGTVKETEEPGAASHPVGWSGTAVPTFRSVKIAGQMVKVQAMANG